jgi:hypothetical protein
MPLPNAIHMGHGQMVDIVERGPEQWELVFSQEGIANYQAPPLAEIKVEAIDGHGAVHALSVAKGSSVSSVLASGSVNGAYRARVMVIHGDHFHTRESLLPGKSAVAAQIGQQGGSLVRFGKATVEARLVAADTFALHFATPQGAPMSAPAADAVVMQAIGPKAEDYQIRSLALSAGDTASTMKAIGKIKDATYLRLTLKDGSASDVRCVPVVR